MDLNFLTFVVENIKTIETAWTVDKINVLLYATADSLIYQNITSTVSSSKEATNHRAFIPGLYDH